ncbi:MAG: hypothetical protein ABT23_07440 [Thiobacillus sp. SCN 63-57]|nr:MAG: hypothetical protein ABT23_07440 [Thiobacillus sp. SCN 63-57]
MPSEVDTIWSTRLAQARMLVCRFKMIWPVIRDESVAIRHGDFCQTFRSDGLIAFKNIGFRQDVPGYRIDLVIRQ